MQAARSMVSGRFTVQLTNIPIIAFKDELAGKEDAVRKFTVDFRGEVRELFDRVGAEGEVALGGEDPWWWQITLQSRLVPRSPAV